MPNYVCIKSTGITIKAV